MADGGGPMRSEGAGEAAGGDTLQDMLPEGMQQNPMDYITNRLLRPQEITNHPEVVRRIDEVGDRLGQTACHPVRVLGVPAPQVPLEEGEQLGRDEAHLARELHRLLAQEGGAVDPLGGEDDDGLVLTVTPDEIQTSGE